MRRNLIAITAACAMACGIGASVRAFAMARPPAEAVTAQMDEYRRVLLAYFKGQDLLPIVLAAGQKPGDVFDVRQWGVLRARSEECFPTLAQPEPVPSTLAFTFSVDSTKANLALGLDRIASLGLGAGFDQTVVVRYTDAKIRSVSQEALRRSVSDACPDVKAVVNQASIPIVADKPPPLLAVVGSLVTAKRQVFIGAQGSVDVKASADQLTTLLASTGVGAALKVAGLEPSASAALGFATKKGVLVTSDDEAAVAFLPAFLPETVFGAMHGSPAQGAADVRWKDVTADSEVDRQRLRSLVDAALLQPR
ncbi:hypothetical protein [Methylobacterium mesophilicum]|uniref:hypothetical protein n=1 Tax=Methylobacterium mesophilicum TaxID=39956 RepID=UPI002F30793E